MPSNDLTVFVIDDDPSIRDALSLMLSVMDYRTNLFANAEDFLKAWKPEWEGCLIADIHMNGMDGLSLQKKLREMQCHIPVIIITGYGDINSAREAFKARALDFLEKPVDYDKLLQLINEAFEAQLTQRQLRTTRQDFKRSFENLTPREREVMGLIVDGNHNRMIADKLSISIRTVEVHKARILRKLGAGNVADLVRINLL